MSRTENDADEIRVEPADPEFEKAIKAFKNNEDDDARNPILPTPTHKAESARVVASVGVDAAVSQHNNDDVDPFANTAAEERDLIPPPCFHRQGALSGAEQFARFFAERSGSSAVQLTQDSAAGAGDLNPSTQHVSMDRP